MAHGTPGRYFKLRETRNAQGTVPAVAINEPMITDRMMIGKRCQEVDSDNFILIYDNCGSNSQHNFGSLLHLLCNH